jgi:hypothetical protein
VKTKRSGARLWLLAFIGFFLLHGAWAVAAPYNGPPDEQAHALRAAAVGHGDLLPSSKQMQDTPDSLYRAHCFVMAVAVAANCVEEPGGDESLSNRFVGAGWYNPVYYAVAGWPVAVWPNWTGILLTRLLTGAAMAALLASAVVAATHWIRRRAVLAGLLVAATPAMVNLGGAINPSGLEIAAGIALFTGLIPLVLEPRDRTNRAAVALVGISASVLVTLRPLGVMWLGIIVVATLFGSSRTQLRELLREGAVRIWLAVVAVSVVGAFVWNAIATPLGITQGDKGLTPAVILRYAIEDQWPNVANQLVGVTGWSELLQPRLVYVAWFMTAGILILGGFAFGGRTEKLRTVFLFGATFLPLLTFELMRVNASGWFNQGRYFLPAAVGLPILGAYTLARSGISPVQFRSLTRTLAVLLVPIHLLVLAYTMTRWQSGLTSLNPLRGSWMPVFGPELPLAAGTLAVLVLIGTYWWASALPAPSRDTPAGARPAEATTTAVDEARRESVLIGA